MWLVSLADGVRRPEEKKVLQAAQRALGLDAADNTAARNAAEKALEDGDV